MFTMHPKEIVPRRGHPLSWLLKKWYKSQPDYSAILGHSYTTSSVKGGAYALKSSTYIVKGGAHALKLSTYTVEAGAHALKYQLIVWGPSP